MYFVFLAHLSFSAEFSVVRVKCSPTKTKLHTQQKIVSISLVLKFKLELIEMK